MFHYIHTLLYLSLVMIVVRRTAMDAVLYIGTKIEACVRIGEMERNE